MSRQNKSGAPSQRMLRVGELVRHALSSCLLRSDIQDETLIGVTITVPEVQMTPDLKLASAYIMPLGGVNTTEIVEALNRHKKFIRGSISSELALKFTPALRFFVDDTFAEADRINELLRSENPDRDHSRN